MINPITGFPLSVDLLVVDKYGDCISVRSNHKFSEHKTVLITVQEVEGRRLLQDAQVSITPAQARKVALALLQLADEIEETMSK